ncbi:8-amino-7-oxononanoate synthase [Altericista sp. CCNU0014]|uniref:8-amino-7-oxononanoate synthase n=1 Tax=Altericista sp. CCNU0014 TaxID=3082949 RepID=UPI00384D8E72
MTPSPSPYDWIDDSLAAIHRARWYRQVRVITSLAGPVVEIEGKAMLNFASNDYLGLAGDERLQQAAIEAIARYGTGSTGSRLLSGHRPVHGDLEQAIARWKQTEAAIVFSSGYSANLGAIAALAGAKDLILGDEYNHSSLKNGAKLSGGSVFDYAHNDTTQLRLLLEQHRSLHRRCLILTDGVFSMDGDICPLPEILALAAEFSCMVLVDDAHGTGVLGATGAGCAEQLGCSKVPLVHVGTLSKALGSLGGYVAGSASLIDFLRNRAATWIYTTALSPAAAAAALAAVRIVQTEPERRSCLWQSVARLRQHFEGVKNLKTLPSESPILCLQLPDAETALLASQRLAERGIFAPAIRPPTVPTSRIRISVMATHQPEHIEQLGRAIAAL